MCGTPIPSAGTSYIYADIGSGFAAIAPVILVKAEMTGVWFLDEAFWTAPKAALTNAKRGICWGALCLAVPLYIRVNNGGSNIDSLGGVSKIDELDSRYAPTGAVSCIAADSCPNTLDSIGSYVSVRFDNSTAAVANRISGRHYPCFDWNGTNFCRYTCDEQDNKFCGRDWSEAL